MDGRETNIVLCLVPPSDYWMSWMGSCRANVFSVDGRMLYLPVSVSYSPGGLTHNYMDASHLVNMNTSFAIRDVSPNIGSVLAVLHLWFSHSGTLFFRALARRYVSMTMVI